MHKFCCYFCVSFFFFFSQISLVRAQPRYDTQLREYKLTQYNDENGLPQNSVKAIARDALGYIWIGTERGLSRFNGRDFDTFNNFGKSYSAQSITAFYPSFGETETPDFFAANDEGRRIHVHHGIAYVDSPLVGRKRYSKFLTGLYDVSVLISSGLPNLFENHGWPDSYLILTGQKLRFVCRKDRIDIYENRFKTKEIKFESESFRNFFRIGESLFYRTGRGMLLRFRPQRGYHKPDTTMLEAVVSVKERELIISKSEIFWNNAANQVFFLYHNSLYFMQAQGDHKVSLSLILNGFNFKSNEIKSVFYDQKSRQLLLGSLTKGLFVFEPKPFRSYRSKIKGSDQVYYGQAPMGENSVLASPGDVFSLDPVSKKRSVKRLGMVAKNTGWDKYAIVISRDRSIWSKRSDTLFKFDSTGRVLLHSWRLGGVINCIYEGMDGIIWVGTKSAGLYAINPRKSQQSPVLFERTLKQITWIQHQNSDIIWIGTEHGLFALHLGTLRVVPMKELMNVYVRSLHIPANQNEVWISTFRDGLFLLKNNRLTKFPLDRMKFLATSHCIFEDKHGYFWITTNNGLFQILKKDLLAYAQNPIPIYYHRYSKPDGFYTNEFNGGCQPCSIRLKNGFVSLPSIDGLVWFIPEAVHPNTPVNDIHIEKVKVMERTLSFFNDSVIVIEPKQPISIKINTVYLGDWNNLNMTYSIGGDNEKYLSIFDLNAQHREINISQLPPGKFILVVRKANGFGVGNFTERRITIIVQRYWYEATWFKVITIMLFLLILYLYFQYRTKRIQDRNRVLEDKIAERTQELEEMLVALRLSKKQLRRELKLRTWIFGSISHDIRAPLRFLLAHVEQLLYHADRIRLDDVRKNNELIFYTLDKVVQFGDNMLDFIKMKMTGNSITLTKTNLYELVAEKIAFFDGVSQFYRNDVDVTISPDLFVNTDRRLFEIIIHNLIDNALKAGQGITICFEARKVGDITQLVVRDTGPGLPQDIIEWINDCSEGTEIALVDQAVGLGLLMVKEIAQSLAISLRVNNEGGACFCFEFP